MNAIASVISIAGLLFTVLVLYNDYRVGLTRQRLFELRDDLFDQAAAGRIAFNSPAYRASRAFFNGSIRYAHRLSLSRALTAALIVPRKELSGPTDEFRMTLARGTDNDMRLCSSYIDRGNRVLTAHLIRSPFAIVIPAVVIAVAAKLGVDLLAKVMARFRFPIAAFDELAFEEGKLLGSGGNRRASQYAGL